MSPPATGTGRGEKAGFRYERGIEHAGLPYALYGCRRGR